MSTDRYLDKASGADRRSRLTSVVRIEQWLTVDGGRASLSQDLDLQLGTRRGQVMADIGKRNTALQRVTPGARCDDSHALIAGENTATVERISRTGIVQK